MQLIDGAKGKSDVTVHVCRAGDGPCSAIRCDLRAVGFYSPGLADFTPLDYYGAHYLEMTFTERYGKVVMTFFG